MATFADMAIELAEAFEARKRTDGTEYTCLRDDAPEWARDAVMAAHGDALPNDWMYSACADAARDIAERGCAGEEFAHIWADEAVDVYNHALVQWLADVPGAWGACEEARHDCAGQVDSLFGLLRRGQFTMLASIYQELALAIELEGAEA